MNKKLKSSLLNIPVAGDSIKLAANLARFNQTKSEFYFRLDRLEKTVGDQEKILDEIKKIQASLEESIQSIQNNMDSTNKLLSFIEKNINIPGNTEDTKKTVINDSPLFADNHLLDLFYSNFEDKFRGEEKIIKDNLRVYLPYLKETKVDFSQNPVLDIGSGRGEMISLLKDNGIDSLGLDINMDMVNRANKKGLTTKQGDAISFLEDSKNQSYGAITGFHIAEHIPFPLLLKIFKEAHRCLVRNGIVIFETPNPENLTVGSTTFYLDPSHLKPLPPALLQHSLETSGFRNVEILRLHPSENKSNKSDDKLSNYIFGPRDYAVIAKK
ncbi:MAG: methyltransferase domain-containing protein [Candidatus Saccharibacteria bacterium]